MQKSIQRRKSLVWNARCTGVNVQIEYERMQGIQCTREQGVVVWDANNSGHLPREAYQCPAAAREGMPLLLLVSQS